MKRLSGAAALVLLAGCLNSADTENVITLPFDFHLVGQDWISGVADVTEAEVADVGLVADLRPLPAPLDGTRNGLHLAGANVAGNVFLFFQKRFTGLSPNATYDAEVAIEFASNIHQGCNTGIGPASFIKAGAAIIEPLAAPDNQGVLRMSIQKGAGSAAGDYIQQSDIRNQSGGCPASGTYAIRSGVFKSQAQKLVTDSFGGFWLWFGIDSGALGVLDIYFTGMALRLR